MGCWTKTLHSNHFRPGAPPFDKRGGALGQPGAPCPLCAVGAKGAGRTGNHPY